MSLVASTTLTPHVKAVRSTVAMKALMAVTGLFLIGFLLVHMWGNLKMFIGPEAYDHYAAWLKGDAAELKALGGGIADGGLGYPLIPQGWFIWIFRVVMLAAIGLHIWSAYVLTRRAWNARENKYVRTIRKAQTYSARTMRWGGVIVALFLIFHLLQFTTRSVPTGFAVDASPYESVVASFQQWWLVALYGLWILLVCMHVRHGFWSAFTTLGANTSVNARKWLNVLAYVVSTALYVGFMIMPVAVLAGVVK